MNPEIENDEVRILLAPVGDPSGWREATYFCDQENKESKSGYYSMVCSGEHDAVILLVQDSIIFPTSKIENRNKLYTRCSERTPCVSGYAPKSYDELIRNVEDYTRCIFSDYFSDGKSLSVIAVPSLGFYEDWCSKEKKLAMSSNASPEMIRSILTIKIYEEVSRFRSSRLTMDVDLTHGINYFNQLTMQAARDVASVFSLTRQQVKLNFYSAIPIVERNQYSYWKVISSEVPALTIYQNKLNYTELEAIKVALESNAPLLLLMYLKKYDLSKIEQDEEKFSKSATLSCDGSSCTVQYDLKAVPPLFKNSYNSYYYIVFRELLRYREIPKEGMYFSTEQVGNIGRETFRFNRVSEHIINTEISKIERMVRNKKDFESDLSEIDKQEGEQGEVHGSSDEYRNFVVHAGLEKDFTRIKKKGDEVLLTYNEKMKDFIKRHKWPPIDS